MEAQPTAFLLTGHRGVKGAVRSQSSQPAWGAGHADTAAAGLRSLHRSLLSLLQLPLLL